MPDVRSGTVTSLFTDIEESTALWEHDAAASARSRTGEQFFNRLTHYRPQHVVSTDLFRGIRHNTSRSCHLNMWGLAHGRAFGSTPARLPAHPTRPRRPWSPDARRTLGHDRADLVWAMMSGQAADTQPDAVSAARDTWPVGHAVT